MLSLLMIRRFFFAILFGLPLVAGATNTLVVFGDSISAGYGLAQHTGWVSLLVQRMTLTAPDYKVVNASISGETLAGGRRRIGAVLEQHNPAVVIIELGGNDGLRGTRIETMQADLQAIVDACLRRKARVLLVGMRLPPNYGAVYIRRFQQIYTTVAQVRPVAFLPFLFEGFGARPEFFQADGIHPTREAQMPMLESIWSVLEPLVSSEKRALAPHQAHQ